MDDLKIAAPARGAYSSSGAGPRSAIYAQARGLPLEEFLQEPRVLQIDGWEIGGGFDNG